MLGTTGMPIHEVLRLGGGAVIEPDASEEDSASVLANGLTVAEGTVVVNGNRIAVEVGELLARPADMQLAGSRPDDGVPMACQWRMEPWW